MKTFALIMAVFLLLWMLASCGVPSRQNEVLASLGEFESKQVWTYGEFQDYADFGYYRFSSAELEENPYFQKVSEADSETILEFIDNFEQWVDTFRKSDADADLVLNYSFDRSIIDEEDYFYIYEGEDHPRFGCYDVWLFDVQTNMLYYFHNNI